MSNIGYGIRHGYFCRFGLPPVTIFEISGAQPSISEHDAVRYADEFRIGELHPRPGVAIVEQYIDARRPEFLVELVGCELHPLRFLVIDRYEHDQEWGQRLRPNDAVVIVILL